MTLTFYDYIIHTSSISMKNTLILHQLLFWHGLFGELTIKLGIFIFWLLAPKSGFDDLDDFHGLKWKGYQDIGNIHFWDPGNNLNSGIDIKQA